MGKGVGNVTNKVCRAAFGKALTIVGEEDPPSEEVEVSALAEEELPGGFVIPEDLKSLVFSDITVFIDPVDGTREFHTFSQIFKNELPFHLSLQLFPLKRKYTAT